MSEHKYEAALRRIWPMTMDPGVGDAFALGTIAAVVSEALPDLLGSNHKEGCDVFAEGYCDCGADPALAEPHPKERSGG